MQRPATRSTRSSTTSPTIRWQMADGDPDLEFGHFREIETCLEGWQEVAIPCDVHGPLLAAGRIADPLVGRNDEACRWVEDRSWWFVGTFRMSARAVRQLQAAGSRRWAFLSLDGLDTLADIALNDRVLGSHASIHYPFEREVGRYLVPGTNRLVLRLRPGPEPVSTVESEAIRPSVRTDIPGEPGRIDLRKPQYVFGWDFTSRIVTCGILGPVRLDVFQGPRIRSVGIRTLTIDRDVAEVAIDVEIGNPHPISTSEGRLRLAIDDPSGRRVATYREDVFLRSGRNDVQVVLPISAPCLWWPNGSGRQDLYTLSASLSSDDATNHAAPVPFGIRTLELQMEKDEWGRSFRFVVNGQPIFCKGSNWVPPHPCPPLAPDDHYRLLVAEARGANLNMLRVWGGGIYERDLFYDLCDRAGILVWQDFMFACALYPEQQAELRLRIEAELEHQTKRLRNHPSLALFAGNNENHWLVEDYWPTYMNLDRFHGALYYNEMMPSVVRRNCPWIPYWNASPYGGAKANADDCGDKHHWTECFMGADMTRRIRPDMYDRATARFVSEYGYLGPQCVSTIRQYLGQAETDRTGDPWDHHVNWFDRQGAGPSTVEAGVAFQFGRDVPTSLEDYVRMAGHCQGVLLEYSLDSLRWMPHCDGALFWMFADMRGEVGWGILDHLGLRKWSYPYVRRALHPVRLMLRESGGERVGRIANDLPESLDLVLECGFMGVDGTVIRHRSLNVRVPGRSRIPLPAMPLAEGEAEGTGFHYLLDRSGRTAPAVLRRFPLCERTHSRPILRVTGHSAREITIRSDRYAECVHLPVPDAVRLSDNNFILVPGYDATVRVEDAPPDFDLRAVSPQALFQSDERDAPWNT